MNQSLPKYPRILAIAPCTKGFGYAVLEGHKILVNWGVKMIEGDKNAGAMEKVEDMIAHYDPLKQGLFGGARDDCIGRRQPRWSDETAGPWYEVEER